MESIEKYKTIGIVGGMGPEAGYALGNSILKNTRATTDQNHLPVVLMSFPNCIGDRSAFLQGEAELNPGYEIVKLISKLETIGAEVVGIACNTAHAPEIFHVVLKELVEKESHVKLLNMPWETCTYIKQSYPKVKRIGVMSSNGTYRAGIYKNQLLSMGYELVIPDFEFQDQVIHRMIYDPDFGIKANPGNTTTGAKKLLEKSLDFFEKNGAELIVLGCTEIPMILPDAYAREMLVINPTSILAKALIKSASQSLLTENTHSIKTN